MSNFDFKKVLRENFVSSKEEKVNYTLKEASIFNKLRGTATKSATSATKPSNTPTKSPAKRGEEEKEPVRKSDQAQEAADQLFQNFDKLIARYLKNPEFEASGKLRGAFKQFFNDAEIPWKGGEDVDDILDILRAQAVNNYVFKRLAPERAKFAKQKKQNESREAVKQVIEEIIKEYEI